MAVRQQLVRSPPHAVRGEPADPTRYGERVVTASRPTPLDRARPDAGVRHA